MPAERIVHVQLVLTSRDIQNIINVMERVKYDGLAEAALIVDLARKLHLGKVIDGSDQSTSPEHRTRAKRRRKRQRQSAKRAAHKQAVAQLNEDAAASSTIPATISGPEGS